MTPTELRDALDDILERAECGDIEGVAARCDALAADPAAAVAVAGRCECGALATNVYVLPVHNGVAPRPEKTPMCEPCAYELAQRLGEIFDV